MDGAVEEPEADGDTVFVIPPPRPLFGFNWASGLVAPFVGSDEAVVAAAVTDALMYHRKSDRFCDGKAPTAVDIGCGDGRVVITAARAGVAALGIDLDEALLATARASAAACGLSSLASFARQDLLSFPSLSSSFDIIFMYLLPDSLVHHRAVESRLWTAVTANGAVLVTLRWHMRDVAEVDCPSSIHAWSSLCIASRSEGFAHPYHIYAKRA